MKTHIRPILLGLALTLLLASCRGGAFGGFTKQTEPITQATISRTVRYYDQGQAGPSYTITVTVPEAWVNRSSTTSDGSLITFNFITPNGRAAPIFTLHTLSLGQFWEQNGSEPTRYQNIAATGETYFVYNVPVDAFYSGLSDADYDALADAVPGIIASFSATPQN